jgi:3-hydroxyisobutyrate dehydrogenase-like beta-hydroxyacid dehydrogenase
MGHAMALNLLKAGHRLIVWNRTRAKAESLVGSGAQVANRPADVARADVIITMLADDNAVGDVMLGSGGIIGALPRGGVHISMSTISVALSDQLTEAHGNARQCYIAAPVFGRPEAAAAAKLFILAAGPHATTANCQQLFDAMGQRTFAIGERPSAANVIKLSGNFMIASMLESLGETFALVRKSGIDPHLYLEVLTGSLFAAPVYRTYGSMIVDEKFQPAGFKLSLALKDIRLALAAAEAKMVPMPAASLVRDHLVAGIAHGRGDLDWAALARIPAWEAGIAAEAEAEA